ncbi:flagellar basal body rod protein FlgB [Botrimarina sp.]|uniref:flagellar basal body rod protein FlgB n=1 Tax=Botrimarina sp. TaxID=2795802 RepID=UPI0032EE1A3A
MPLDPLANSTLPVLERVLAFTQARHGVLAGNIANINTPDYKTRDLSVEAFQQSLARAIRAERPVESPGYVIGPLAEEPTGLVSLGAGGRRPLGVDRFAEADEAAHRLVYHDGRDVSLEEQITQINKNKSLHNLAIALMTSQFRQLQAAISESVV